MAAAQGSMMAHAGSRSRDAGLFHEFRMMWRDLRRAMFDRYHPERHYMRGPGPACAAKSGGRG
jgi:hypothetical protein